MIEIMDHPQESQPYLEVYKQGSSEQPEKVIYYPDGLDGIDRENALKKIFDLYGKNNCKLI